MRTTLTILMLTIGMVSGLPDDSTRRLTWSSAIAFAQDDTSETARRERNRGRWESLSESQRQEMLSRWEALPPDAQDRIRKNFLRWKDLSPEQRTRVERRFQNLRDLPPQERRRLLQQSSGFEALSPVEREHLLQRLDRPRDRPSNQFQRPPTPR